MILGITVYSSLYTFIYFVNRHRVGLFVVNNNNNSNNNKYIFHTSIGADLLKFTLVLILLNTLNDPFV